MGMCSTGTWVNRPTRDQISRTLRASLLLSLLLSGPGAVHSERLPIKGYTTADGLPRDNINRIVQDSKGFLWFCTTEGLSRFDGYKFTNYGMEQGLPSRNVNGFLESRSGVYWVATGKGLCRFNPDTAQQAGNGVSDAAQRFVVYYPGESAYTRVIDVVYEDHAGTIWCGTDVGLFRLDQINGQWVFSFADIIRPAATPGIDLRVRAILEDRNGALWVSAESGLHRRRPDGGVEVYTAKNGLPIQNALLEDRIGRLWAGTSWGLYQLVTAKRRQLFI